MDFPVTALNLFETHRYAAAAALCRHHLETDPEDLAAMSGLAMSLRALGSYVDALPYFEKVGESRRRRLSGPPVIKKTSPVFAGAREIGTKRFR